MRYTVLTYIFGGYEHVREVKERDPEAEYVLVTDDPELRSDTWRVIYDRMLDGMTVWEKCYAVRFCPFGYANTDMVLRVDGSISIKRSLRPFVEKMEQGYDRCLMIHPYRNTIPEEYDVWVRERNYPRKQADRCIDIMKGLGYDLEYKGLFQGTFEIVKRSRINSLVNAMTYDLLKYAATDSHIQRINQTWLSFVVNKLFENDLKVLPVSEEILHGSWMEWYGHGVDDEVPLLPMTDPYMFDKPVEIWNP